MDGCVVVGRCRFLGRTFKIEFKLTARAIVWRWCRDCGEGNASLAIILNHIDALLGSSS